MATLLLIIIYLIFISLGLPDSLLGVAWPKIHADLGVPISYAGITSMIISGGTIISSFASAKVIKRFGTSMVTLVSVAMTAAAILGFSASPSFLWLCLAAAPLGLGAGAIDAALNNFVAVHYKANHMSWLHSFWGIGASSGPVIMSFFIVLNNGWRKGAIVLAAIQFSIVLILLISLPLWKKFAAAKTQTPTEEEETEHKNSFKLPMIKTGLVPFFFYCATEATAGLWGGSYLVTYKGLSVDMAARGVALFFVGITAGRALNGFATIALKNYSLIRIGQLTCLAGAVITMLPLPVIFTLADFLLIGLGCAPIYPSMLHENTKPLRQD
ncbi:Fucose permease [Elusimicrobium minutum Pei191]|uniref:Fucose permease n=1 Tax=Elusimicrobium minutum (strain Pei191) TaxID=445932 RepID=B2KCT5_ELUMP|nr:MFS transporter [Elusimicrobium minutum]ACC98331.1 Fucose permease [Elusimicrobium minutum Pei191]